MEPGNTLWFWVEDDKEPSQVPFSFIDTVDSLMDKINVIRRLSGKYPIPDMRLWQLNHPIPFTAFENTPFKFDATFPDPNSQEALNGNGDTRLLQSFKRLSRYWGEKPLDDHLHLVVQIPRLKCIPDDIAAVAGGFAVPRSASLPRHLGGHIVPRTELVKLIEQRLSEYRIIQIRGTPACGKTTLCNLLHIYLKAKNFLVYTIEGWSKGHYKERLQEICGPFHPTRPTYLLFDEGQDTYSDTDLWNFFFKSLRSQGNMHVALFCCYGTTSSRLVEPPGIPDVFDEPQRICLLPTPATPLGIFMSHDEFTTLLGRYPHPLNLADEVREEILKWTAGHIGGIDYLLDSIRRKNSATMRSGTLYDLTKFHDDHPPSDVGHGFRYSSGGRGLPEPNHLKKDPSMTSMFLQLLRNGQLLEDDQSKFGDAVERAHKKGYIYAKLLAPSQEKRYVIPTPLHTVGLSWILLPAQVDLPSDLITLVWEVVRRFKFSQLTLPIRRAGPETTGSPPGAQYQDEFYRALHDFTKGGVLVSPEFASASGTSVAGRIDFYIASKKWGIEITRDGKKLQEHSDRFGACGACGRWLASGKMSDYILLDCRSTKPIKPHSWIPNLFHAVFNQATQSVTVYNNRCEELVSTTALLENH